MSSAICLNLDQSKILSSGNGLSSVVLETERYISDILKLDQSNVFSCDIERLRGPEFNSHSIYWWVCLWARHFRTLVYGTGDIQQKTCIM